MVKATLRLNSFEHRFEFEAEDFFLRFTVSDLLTSIEKVLEIDGGFISFIANGEEEHLDLSDVTANLNLKWDFFKYDLEVII